MMRVLSNILLTQVFLATYIASCSFDLFISILRSLLRLIQDRSVEFDQYLTDYYSNWNTKRNDMLQASGFSGQFVELSRGNVYYSLTGNPRAHLVILMIMLIPNHF